MATKLGESGGGTGRNGQRRAQLRLEISREAARLFWDQGVAATGGDQIAEAVGLSTRTIWRHFRTKESLAEPVLARGAVTLLRVLHSWPRSSSLEDHLAAELTGLGHETPPDDLSDATLATQVRVLSDTEPALRTACLMACDRVEREMRALTADRLRRPPGDPEVRLHAAAATAALRVLDEHIGAAVLAGVAPPELTDVHALSRHLAHAIRTATGGVVGAPVA